MKLSYQRNKKFPNSLPVDTHPLHITSHLWAARKRSRAYPSSYKHRSDVTIASVITRVLSQHFNKGSQEIVRKETFSNFE